MKVEAVESFCGAISMYGGEVRDIASETLVKDLMQAGYITPCTQKRGVKNESKRNND